MPPTLGKQLTRRVNRGETTGKQARQTAMQRQTFKAAYGDNWRTKVFGKGGAKGIASSGPFGERDVAARRSQMLQAAQAKLKGRVAPAQKARRKPQTGGLPYLGG